MCGRCTHAESSLADFLQGSPIYDDLTTNTSDILKVHMKVNAKYVPLIHIALPTEQIGNVASGLG